jgi:F0F1-type ATP synthase assembly protein I
VTTKKQRSWQSTSLSTIGLDLVASVLVGFFGGRWLDGKLGTDPWLGLLGLAFGIGAAIRSLTRGMREMKEIARREEEEQGNPRPTYGETQEDVDHYKAPEGEAPPADAEDRDRS